MTILEFKVNDVVLQEDLKVSPGTASSAALEETYFVMPVRLCISGVELFHNPRHATIPWLELPLIGIARSLGRALGRLKESGAASVYLAGGGELLMEQKGNEVCVTSTIDQRCARVDHLELRDATMGFCADVRDFVLRHAPDLESRPIWSQ
jgi:hypothetical protein